MLVGSIVHAAWKLHIATKAANYTVLILKGELEIDLESNTCMPGKLSCK